MELPGEDQVGDPSPRPGMRERERVHVRSTQHTVQALHYIKETDKDIYSLYSTNARHAQDIKN